MVTLTDLHNLPASDVIDLRITPLVLQRKNKNVCAEGLINGNLSVIKRSCRYHVVHAPLPRAVTKIGTNMLLLSNIKEVTIGCEGKTMIRQNVTEVQHVISVHCGCLVTVDEFSFYELSIECHLSDLTLNITPKFVLNLPFISELVNPQTLSMFRADTLLDSKIPADLPKLAIASKNYSAKLGIENQARFDLERIINNTRADAKTFPSLSHYLSEVIASHSYDDDFDIFNIWNWLEVGTMIITAGLIVFCVMLYCKYKSLAFVLAVNAKHAVSAANDFPTRFHVRTTQSIPTTQFTTEPYHKIVTDLLPVDVSILFFFLLFMILTVVYVISCRVRRAQKHTSIWLEIAITKLKT